MKIIFIGTIVPDEDAYNNRAFSRAGNLAQEGFIQALKNSDADLDIFSFAPMASFPKGKVVSFRQNIILNSNILYKLMPYLNLPILKYFSMSIVAFLNLSKSILQSEDSKVYIVSYNFNTFLSIPMLLARTLGNSLGKEVYLIPILFDVHKPSQVIPSFFLENLSQAIFLALVNRIDGMVAITKNVARDFSNGTPSIILEGGVTDSSINRFYFLNRDSIPNFNILLAGALEKYNGIDIALKAMNHIFDSNVRLIIAGKGSLSRLVEEASIQDSRIEYVGFISHEDLLKLYRRADVLINHRSHKRINSEYVFPSKLLEYMLTGIPTISTRFHSLPAQYESYLYLLEDESAEELAATIMNVKREGIVRNKAAADFIRQEKSWKAWANKIAMFLKSL